MKIGIKKFLIFMMTFLMMSIFACSEYKVELDNAETETLYVVEPANQFAIDKETEVETAKPTEAHKPYPADFKLAPAAEVTIGEKDFLTRINYIYNHIDDFAASKIIVEGMYGLYTSWDKTFEFPIVYRNGPGDYGDDSFGGFYLVNIPLENFTIDDWIRVKGTPFMYEHTDSEGEVQKYLFLLVETYEILPVKDRKAEMVNN